MRKVALIIFVSLLSGCALFNRGMDGFSARLVKEATDYCAAPYHRRLALYTLVNGELEQQKIEIAVICPADPTE